MNTTIEIAVTDVAGALSAINGGADRIELCSALSEGGLTPSHGAAHVCVQALGGARVFPIIRPRGGDFVYSAHEQAAMLHDITVMRELGCAGIVLGALTPEGDVDADFLRQMMQAAQGLAVTFHRAFDRARDPRRALETLIALGCARLLTSGQQRGAPEGATLIRALHEQAAGRIVVMPGAGVRVDNIAALKAATGCTEFHASLRGTMASKSRYVHAPFDRADYDYPGVEPAAVRALRDAVSV